MNMPAPQHVDDQAVARAICSQLEFAGQRFRRGQYVAVLQGKVLAVGETFEEVQRAMATHAPDPHRGLICLVDTPVTEVIRLGQRDNGVALVSFPFHLDCPVVEVQFHRTDGTGSVTRRLLVDSGFTGQSASVLSPADAELVMQRPAPDADVAGALHGRQRRIWVICSMAQTEFREALLAICSDLTPLALPQLVEGVAGLAVLRRVHRWGGERRRDEEWHFVLESVPTARVA